MSRSGRSSTAPISVPEQLEPLVEKLADLNEQDRELVIRAARRRRRSKVELKPVPWDVLWRSSGTVSFGGNALEDTSAIYDG
jgi:hypothetical protein